MPPRPGVGVELTTRSDAADLAPLLPGPGGKIAVPKYQELLVGEAESDAWRIVEVFSRSGRPFEVDLSWSAGTGTGAHARITVSHSARICVLARSLRVAAANLTRAENRVGVTVGDGFAVTHNATTVRGQGPGPTDVAVPPFAERARLDVADAALRSQSRLAVLDGTEATCGEWLAPDQPPDGVALAGALTVRISLPSPAQWRVVFTLCL